jgi:hypothetical protein
MTDDSYLDEAVPLPVNGVKATAAALRALKQATGATFAELLADVDEANRLQAMMFVELHKRATRLGHIPEPQILWEQAGLVEIDIPDTPDLARRG